MICIADREGKKIECLRAGLVSPKFSGQTVKVVTDVGRVYAIAKDGDQLVAVSGQEFLRSSRVNNSSR